jgi:Ca2+-binding EF-hand superfamily protein
MAQEEKLSIKKLQDAFGAFDTDKNGSIDSEELMVVFDFKTAGYNVSEVEAMIKEVDENGDGQIQFNEFKNMMMGE